MLTNFSEKLNQKELSAIEQANAILRDARFEMNELFNHLSEEVPHSEVIYEIITFCDAIDATQRASEILMMYAKLLKKTEILFEND